jgi:hypothetical protein
MLATVYPCAVPVPAASGSELLAQLQQLSQFCSAGVLSDKEFDQPRQKLLAG